MRLTIYGDTPSKKNGKRLIRKGNRTIPISSKRYMDWNKDAVAQLKEQFAGYVVSGYPIGMAIEIYPKYQYRQDLTNRAESIMDTLVDAGILADDDIAHVDSLSISFCEYDKANPRAVVYLDE